MPQGINMMAALLHHVMIYMTCNAILCLRREAGLDHRETPCALGKSPVPRIVYSTVLSATFCNAP
ncbi:hypothetical protein D3870_15325 [Noviherbaspirillum cavernae]|uniref:Uncharacterized protein n=1 Tax=Noviherbaspirillum cavernae TaxID=2320862 RepID=A0A418X403_9BURK|nr:hypothetical protein D3870_15325 [Noviherbaspirillum cavernae]